MSGDVKGWATPAPAGLFALALAEFCFYAALMGKIKPGGLALLGIWLLGGFVVQVIAGLIEYKEGELLGGNLFTIFAAFFMFSGGMGFIFKYFAILYKLPLDTLVDGYAWLSLWIVLLCFTPAYMKKSVFPMGLLMLGFDIGVGIIAFVDLGLLDHAYMVYAAYLCIWGGAMAIWVATAVVINSTWGKTIIPLPGPMIK